MARVEEDLIMDGQVQRLHAVLVAALRRARSAPFDGPVTVAEIYQDLVPYRSVRAALGFEMNADYEHTLLRLLAGEAELARLDPPEAAAELRDELESPNPNVGLFRKFAGCDVWIAAPAAEPAHVEPVPDANAWLRLDPSLDWHGAREATPPIAPATADDPGEVDAASRTRAPDAASPAKAEIESVAAGRGEALSEPVDDAEEPEYELVPVQRRAGAGVGGETDTGRRCAFCDASLPGRRALRYCPFCGTDQSHRPCPGCSEAVEPGWRFCIACGTNVDGAA